MTNSAVFFTYGSQEDLDYIISGFSKWPFDEVLVAVGGEIELHLPEGPENSGRIKILREPERLGKTVSYNKVLKYVTGNRVFIISGDVRFQENVPSYLLSVLKGDVGMVIPRVVPEDAENLANRVGITIWKAHEIFNSLRSGGGEFFCGGEFQLMDGIPPSIPEGIINDDEYLGAMVFSSGKRILYCTDVEVRNRTPDSFIDLLRQRVRVNYGHLQCLKLFRRTSSFSLEFGKNPWQSISILKRLVDGKPGNAFILFLAIYIEFLSILFSRIYHRMKIDFTKWKMVNSDARYSK